MNKKTIKYPGQNKSTSWKIILILSCILLNFGGRFLAGALGLPFWLDTIGTMMSGIILGPIFGGVCGLVTSLFLMLLDKNVIYYIGIGFITGVMTGYIYPRLPKGSRLEVLSVAMLEGLIAASISAPIDIFVFEGTIGNAWGDALVEMLNIYVNVSNVNIWFGEALVDLPDRIVSITAALFIAGTLMKFFEKADRRKKKEKAAAAFVIILLPALVFPLCSAKAADILPEFDIVYYGREHGLDDSEVTDIIQTEDGYIWLGSYNGLFRYDGLRFENIQLHPAVKNVRKLFVDSRQRLWIGTNDSGVVCYDFVSGEGTLFDSERGLKSDAVRYICEDNNGNIYVATDREVAKIMRDGQIKIFDKWPDVTAVEALKSAPSGDVIGVTENGMLFVIRNDMLIFDEEIDIEDDETTRYRSLEIVDDQIYVGTTGDLIVQYKKEGDIYACRGRFSLGINNVVELIHPSGANGLIVCSKEGVGYLDFNTRENLMANNLDFSIEDALMDYQGNIWLLSKSQGVIKCSRTPFLNLLKAAGIESQTVNAIIKKDDRLYMGSEKGLIIIDTLTNEPVTNGLTTDVSGYRIRDVMEDSKGNLWLSTYSSNAVIKVCSDGEVKYLGNKQKDGTNRKCRFALELSDGKVALSSNGEGLVFFDGDTEVQVIGKEEGMSNTTILCAAEREDGSILAGSDGDGIYIINNGKIAGNIGKTEGLTSGVILQIKPCSEGYIYVTGNALFFDNGNEIKNIDTFPHNDNYDVLFDGEGNAYVTSSAGLYSLPEKELLEYNVQNYTLMNVDWGLTGRLKANAKNEYKDGVFYLACVDGARALERQHAKVEISDFKMHLKEVVYDGGTVYPKDGKVTIPAVPGRIVFNIAVNNYTFSNPRIRYYLEGSGDDGILCLQDEIFPLSFTNLPQGKYKLHIQVLDNNSSEIIKEEIIDVEKEAQMYELWYFRAYIIFVLGYMAFYLVWLFYTMQSRAKSIRELKNEMITDPMTGILNKAGANRLIGEACEKETGMLVMIDLDSFKLVNDIYGHDMGDKVLIRFAELIKENIREEDLAGRLGGDEFMAFLKDTLDEEAVERLCRALNAGIVRSAKEYMGEGMNIPLGASLGAVKITGPGGDYDDLFRKADKALYSVKQNGKHGYAFYEKSGSEKDDDKDWDNKNNLEQIKKIISERNEGKGAYRITFEKMQVIYRFLSRDDRMKGNDTAFFRIVPASGGKRLGDDLLESIADELVTKLKRDDVVSIYAGCIFVMMRDMKNSDCMDRLKKITDGWLADNAKEKEIKISMEMDVV